MADLLVNLLMLGFDAGALALLHRPGRPHWREQLFDAAAALALVSLGAVLLAAAVGIFLEDNAFGYFRLLAWGLFLHVTAAAALGAGLLRSRKPTTAAVLTLAAAGLATVAVDAFLIEPRWLEVRQVNLRSEKLDEPLRIAVLADLQTDEIGSWERSVLETLLAQEPDLILLPGDYLQEDDFGRYLELQRELQTELERIGFGAPLGAIAVGGNTDSAMWPYIFQGLPVTATERTRGFEPRRDLRVTALSVNDSFDETLEIAAPKDGRFHIVVGHSPDFALGEVAADLLVAGHTHGGQVRLPLLGPLLTLSSIPRAWAAGTTRLPSGGTLIVSRGAGMERGAAPRLRFLCRPEITVIEVSPRTEPP